LPIVVKPTCSFSSALFKASGAFVALLYAGKSLAVELRAA
jgi:hypothetical protein